MRHRIDKKYLGRDTNARKGAIVSLVANLFEHGEIITTKAKASVASRQAEKMITIAKKDDLATRRRLHRFFGRRDMVNNLVDRVAPVFASRQSGFTRLIEVGNRRGDNTTLYKLSLVEILPAKIVHSTENDKADKK